jgi:hypothetical protein
MVIGSRFCNDCFYPGNFMQRVGQVFFSQLSRLLVGQRIYDTTSGFKALRRRLIKCLFKALHGLSYEDDCPFEPAWVGNCRVFDHRRGTCIRAVNAFIKSVFHYPLKTLLLTMVAAMDVFLAGG